MRDLLTYKDFSIASIVASCCCSIVMRFFFDIRSEMNTLKRIGYDGEEEEEEKKEEIIISTYTQTERVFEIAKQWEMSYSYD